MLERVPPEKVGIKSTDVRRFLMRLNESKLFLHSFMLIKNNCVAAEGAWSPWTMQRKHRMYSVSKSFVSMAVGILSDRGLVSLDDRICRFFPEYPVNTLYPHSAQLTVRDMLRMATCFRNTTYSFSDKNWIQTFFTAKPTHPSGTYFNYDTSSSYILGVLVKRLTGMDFLEYLYENALKYIGFSPDAYCIRSPEGEQWAGSGVVCTTEDLARFSLLVLNRGCWEGRQLISESYIDAAVSFQISNDIDGDSNALFRNLGYGYQVWMTKDGYSFIGMGSQLCIFVPKKELLFVCTADTQGNSTARSIIYDAFFTNIVNTASDGMRINNYSQYDFVLAECDALHFHLPCGELFSGTQEQVAGKKYKVEVKDGLEIDSVRFDFTPGSCKFTYMTPRGEKQLICGFGQYIKGEFPETHYSGLTIGKPLGRGYEYYGTAVWVEKNKLRLYVYITDDYFGNLHITAAFVGDGVTIKMTKAAEAFLGEYNGSASFAEERTYSEV